MKIRLLGFEYENKGPVSLADFQAGLEAENNTVTKFGKGERFLLAGTKGPFNAGLLITVKDHQRFCQIQQAHDKLEVTVHELEEGTAMMDFNFFLWNPNTGRGVYQYYHHSCAFSRFDALLAEKYSLMKHRLIEAAIAQSAAKAPGFTLSENQKKKIRRKLKGRFHARQLVRKEDLATLVSEMDEVKKFTLDFTTLRQQSDPLFRPVSAYLQRQRVSFSFDPKRRSENKLKEIVLEMAGTNDAKGGRVEGRDADKNPITLELTQNYSFFGEYDFDDVAKDMSFSLDEWEKSKVLDYLAEAMNQNAILMETPAQ